MSIARVQSGTQGGVGHCHTQEMRSLWEGPQPTGDPPGKQGATMCVRHFAHSASADVRLGPRRLRRSRRNSGPGAVHAGPVCSLPARGNSGLSVTTCHRPGRLHPCTTTGRQPDVHGGRTAPPLPCASPGRRRAPTIAGRRTCCPFDHTMHGNTNTHTARTTRVQSQVRGAGLAAVTTKSQTKSRRCLAWWVAGVVPSRRPGPRRGARATNSIPQH